MEDKTGQELTPSNPGQVNHFPPKTYSVEGVSPLLQLAMQPGFDPSNLAKMMELQEKYEQNEARKAYHKSLAAFKSKAPKIEKTKEVKFPGKGGAVSYWHADLADSLEKVNPVLSEYGLNITWKTEQEGGQIKVTAILAHEQGHSDSTSLVAGADTSGGKNSIQSIVSTVSYLRRHTAFCLLGLASSDQDNDGATAEMVPQITEQQMGTLRDLIDATGAADTAGMAQAICREYRVYSLAEIPADKFQTICNRLNATIKKNQGSK